ncbi:MAG: AI-2E family transporter [Burkholderiales bacterium]|nr:AI-2E family transporter [Burkholderiales bacterium]
MREQVQALSSRVAGIVGTATVLALLYFGRDVLIPITLALMLSLLIAPLIHALRRLGLGQAASVGLAVVALACALSAVTMMIGGQVVRMGQSLPQYESTIRGKLRTLDDMTLGRIGDLSGQAGRVFSQLSEHEGSSVSPTSLSQGGATSQPIPVELREPPPRPMQLLTRVFSTVWEPIETAGIVFVVLIFVLLEHEALRDRFIRLIGAGDLRATTNAVNDASKRLSRFFVSQFAVNVAVGVLVWLGLAVIGLPQAALWGAMAAILRFVPYVGVWITAAGATLLAAAVVPGWSLAIMTLGLFFVIEMIVSQTVEPLLYGHSTGLSPLSVVVAAIFWSWIWGPVGLIVSTPLTLCLVVAGHYIKGLSMLEILLGEAPALSMSQNFYQRALSGDAQEIIASGKQFLKRQSFAAYCDTVLLPAMHLARTDFEQKAINQAEQRKVGGAIVAAIEALAGSCKQSLRHARMSVLADVNIGRQLRDRREKYMGQWQGPLDAPVGSVVLVVGMGGAANELAAEVCVRVQRAQQIDARHLSLEELENPPPGASPDIAAMVCFVSVAPSTELARLEIAAADVRRRLPHARILALLLPSPFQDAAVQEALPAGADQTVHSYADTLQCSLDVLHRTE